METVSAQNEVSLFHSGCSNFQRVLNLSRHLCFSSKILNFKSMSWPDDFLPSGWKWLNFSLDKRHYVFLLGEGWWRHSVCCNRILQLKFPTFRGLVIFLSILTMSHDSTSHSMLIGDEELGFAGLLSLGHWTVFNCGITGLMMFLHDEMGFFWIPFLFVFSHLWFMGPSILHNICKDGI